MSDTKTEADQKALSNFTNFVKESLRVGPTLHFSSNVLKKIQEMTPTLQLDALKGFCDLIDKSTARKFDREEYTRLLQMIFNVPQRDTDAAITYFFSRPLGQHIKDTDIYSLIREFEDTGFHNISALNSAGVFKMAASDDTDGYNSYICQIKNNNIVVFNRLRGDQKEKPLKKIIEQWHKETARAIRKAKDDGTIKREKEHLKRQLDATLTLLESLKKTLPKDARMANQFNTQSSMIDNYVQQIKHIATKHKIQAHPYTSLRLIVSDTWVKPTN
jgi:hypothetical protein